VVRAHSSASAGGSAVWATQDADGSHAIYAKNYGDAGAGISGNSVGVVYGTGVSANSTAENGIGVYGYVGHATGNTEGVYGHSISSQGRGVLGVAPDTGSGYTKGVQGLASSTNGIGVDGRATATTGATEGVYGHSDSNAGKGVAGYAPSTTGVNYGVWGRNMSPDGYGVFGTGPGVGVYAESTGSKPALKTSGDADVGGDLLLRYHDSNGISNRKVRFKVKPATSGLMDDDDEDDVEVTTEDEEGEEEPATIRALGINLPDPDEPTRIVRVRGSTGGVSEDPVLAISGGIRLGEFGGPQVDIDVLNIGGVPGLDVKGPINGSSIVAASMDISGSLELSGPLALSGPLDFGGGNALGMEDGQMNFSGPLALSGPLDFGNGNALGMEGGQLNFQGNNGFAFASNNQQVNFNVTDGGSLALSDQFGSSSVLQVGSAVEAGGLFIQDGGNNITLGAGNSGGSGQGTSMELDDPIYELRAQSWNDWGVMGSSIGGGGVLSTCLGLDTSMEVSALLGDGSIDVFRIGKGNINANGDHSGAWQDLFTVSGYGEVVVTSLDDNNSSLNKRALLITDNRTYGRCETIKATTKSNGTGATWNPVAVYGRAETSTSNVTIGVRGWSNSSNGYGIYSDGDFGGNSGKYFLQPHPTDPSKQIRFACLEGNESGTYCRGTDTLVNGVCTIELPEDFQLASESEEITVQVTALEGPGMIWVEHRDRERVVVRGNRDISFDWFVNGVRRGFAGLETIQENHAFKPEGMDLHSPAFGHFRPAYRQLLVDNGLLNEDFTPNLETAARLGWKEADPRPDEGNPEAAKQRIMAELVSKGYLTPEGTATAKGRAALGAKGD
jgi:hypothetical protein